MEKHDRTDAVTVPHSFARQASAGRAAESKSPETTPRSSLHSVSTGEMLPENRVGQD